MTKSIRRAFSINGDFLTNQARALLKEVGFKKALTFLDEALDGLALSDAMAILRGTKSLVGTNNAIELAACDEEKTLALDWKNCHANIFEYAGCYWKAYGYVDGYSYDDMKWALEELQFPAQSAENRHCFLALTSSGCFKSSPAWSDKEDIFALRNLYYAKNKSSDIAVGLRVGAAVKVVLFERVFLDRSNQSLQTWTWLS